MGGLGTVISSPFLICPPPPKPSTRCFFAKLIVEGLKGKVGNGGSKRNSFRWR